MHLSSVLRDKSSLHKIWLPLLLVAGLSGPSLQAQDSEIITAIEVTGSKKLTPETVIFKSGLKVGDDLRTVDLGLVLEKLWASGAFEDIRFETEELEDGSGKKLYIRVAERPIVKEVDYRGGTEIGLTNLKDKIKEKKLTITENTVYDPDTARKVKALIVEQCAEKGYRNPVIDVVLEPLGGGLARLVFDIKEGGKVRIYKIKFRGNKLLTDKQLAGFMGAMEKTREHWTFSWLSSHDLLVEKNMEEDLQNVKKAYWRHGYKDVFVGQPTIDVQDFTTARQKKKNEKRISEAKSPKYDLRATLTIPVLEGEQFFEGKIAIEGNHKLYRGELGEKALKYKIAEAKRDNRSWVAKILDLKPSVEDLPSDKNRPFDLDALSKGVDKIKEAYSNASYIMAGVEKKYDVREENGVKKVDTTLKIHEGDAFTIRRINFEGNTTTKDKVLRRALAVREGDPFSFEVFKESYTGLGQLGFFDVKGSEPDIKPDSEKPVVDITIKGEEAGVNEVLFQGGYGELFGFTLGASFNTKNLGGNGESLGFSYNGGKFQRSFSINFMEPYVFDKPYSLSVGLSDGRTNYDASRVGEANAFEQESRTLSIGTGVRLDTLLPNTMSRWARWVSYSVGYSFSKMRIIGGRNYYYRDTSSQLTSSLNQSLSYNTVNHPFKPTNGMKAAINFEYGGWQFGTDRPYYRTGLEFTKITNIAERHIFALNMSYGYLRNLSDQPLPIWNLYRPGGEQTLRGYQYGQVGSVMLDYSGYPVTVGGNKQFLANVEYQFKIADQFRVVLFYDAGNAWKPGEKIFNRDLVEYTLGETRVSYKNPFLARSTGVELRFFLPISPAPLRLIWARKLNPYPFDRESETNFQFSIGTTF